MYYSETGDEAKKFNAIDGKGFEILRLNCVKTGIITSEETKIVARRAQKVKVDYLFQGCLDKLTVVSGLRDSLGIGWENIAYIGDDINDIDAMRMVGLSACPLNAQMSVKSVAKIHLRNRGGDGALREFAEIIIQSNIKNDI
jgi:YrbI family 3-deoxy-D-manno-octulosonate 8-phosphate phosphatase